MTVRDYNEINDYNFDCDCENCKYHVWLDFEWICEIDLICLSNLGDDED